MEEQVLELIPAPQQGFKQSETGRQHCRWQERPEQTWGSGKQHQGPGAFPVSAHPFSISPCPQVDLKMAAIISDIVVKPNLDQKQKRLSLPVCPGAASEEPRAPCQHREQKPV